MKTFEERYTAWLDDELEGVELAAFEKELETHADAAEDKLQVEKLGICLRKYGKAPALTNTDFFNNQIMARIAAETRPAAPERRSFRWPLPHLAWAGACCLLIAYTLFHTLVPLPDPNNRIESPLAESMNLSTPLPAIAEHSYDVEVLDATSPDPQVSVSTVQSTDDRTTVLWVDGLEYFPAGYRLE